MKISIVSGLLQLQQTASWNNAETICFLEDGKVGRRIKITLTDVSDGNC